MRSARIAAGFAIALYAITATLVGVSFTTEYNLAQGIVLVYLGVISLGLAIVATVVWVLVSVGSARR